MYVKDTQTLFYMRSVGYTVRLFDLKSLTNLDFPSKSAAIDFCKHYNETECINEILNTTGQKATILYLETNNKTKKHKVVYTVNPMRIRQLNSNTLFHHAKSGEVMNVELGTNGKLKIKWLVPKTDLELEKEVATQYEEFRNTMRLLGKNVNFKYTIIGNYVILTESKSVEVLNVPRFITSVSCQSNNNRANLRKINMMNGVRFIGSGVINFDTEIIYGDTLEYIGNTNHGGCLKIIK